MSYTDESNARELTLIKIWAISSIVVGILSYWLPSIAGMFCALLAFVVMFGALGKLCRLSGSETLRKNYVKILLYPLVGAVFLFAGIPFMKEMPFLFMLFCFLFFCFCVGGLVVMYKYHKELSAITQQPLFLWAFWITVTPLSFIGIIMELLAWILAKDIYEAEELSVSTLEWVAVFLVPFLSFSLAAVLASSFLGSFLPKSV